jgi:hypothetical protein
MAQSVLQQLKKLDDERNKLIAGAKAEAMDEVNKALAELNSLGFSYKIVEGSATKAKGTARSQKDAPCKICNFKTSPLHDARAHRSQDKKKAFTEAELAARGMMRVS